MADCEVFIVIGLLNCRWLLELDTQSVLSNGLSGRIDIIVVGTCSDDGTFGSLAWWRNGLMQLQPIFRAIWRDGFIVRKQPWERFAKFGAHSGAKGCDQPFEELSIRYI